MHIYAIPLEGMAQHLPEKVPAALNIEVGGILALAILVDLQHLTEVAATAQFFDHQLGLHRPATHRRRIITYFEYFDRWAAGRRRFSASGSRSFALEQFSIKSG